MAQVSKGITSRSSLQRWESGQGEMAIEKVSQLLARIHIQPEEYIDKVGMSKLKIYTQGVEEAYAKNDVHELKRIALILLKKYADDKDNIQLLFQTAVACNFYLDLSNVNLFPHQEKIRLKSYFLAINDWSVENVLLFGDVQCLLSVTDVYVFARSLLSYLVDQPHNNHFFAIAIDTLLNAVFVLIKGKRVAQARQLLKQIEGLQISEKYSDKRIRIKFMETLFDFIKSGSDSSFQDLVQSLHVLGFNKQANDFEFAFHQIKDIY